MGRIQKSLNHGGLEWETSNLSKQLNFIDLTIIQHPDQSFSTRTYQKVMNLYLYLPKSSAHPPSALKGLVTGNLIRYWEQNSNKDDYIKIARSFAQRLLNRGYSVDDISPLFQSAAKRIMIREHSSTDDDLKLVFHHTKKDPKDTLFFKTEYHPKGLSRRLIHNIYNKYLKDKSGFESFMISYSRPKNLRDLLIKTKLSDTEGIQASYILEKMKKYRQTL